jgi:hypothetical protein
MIHKAAIRECQIRFKNRRTGKTFMIGANLTRIKESVSSRKTLAGKGRGFPRDSVASKTMTLETVLQSSNLLEPLTSRALGGYEKPCMLLVKMLLITPDS